MISVIKGWLKCRGTWETNQNHKKVPCAYFYCFASLVDRRETVSCIWSKVYVLQVLSTKILSFPQVYFQHFNHSCFAAQDFAEQLFCKTSSTDCVWFIWLRTGIYIFITKYILRKWRSYFSCIFFIFSELSKNGPGLIWWLQTTLRPLIILAVQNLKPLRNMQLQ